MFFCGRRDFVSQNHFLSILFAAGSLSKVSKPHVLLKTKNKIYGRMTSLYAAHCRVSGAPSPSICDTSIKRRKMILHPARASFQPSLSTPKNTFPVTTRRHRHVHRTSLQVSSSLAETAIAVVVDTPVRDFLAVSGSIVGAKALVGIFEYLEESGVVDKVSSCSICVFLLSTLTHTPLQTHTPLNTPNI